MWKHVGLSRCMWREGVDRKRCLTSTMTYFSDCKTKGAERICQEMCRRLKMCVYESRLAACNKGSCMYDICRPCTRIVEGQCYTILLACASTVHLNNSVQRPKASLGLCIFLMDCLMGRRCETVSVSYYLYTS